MGDTAIQILLYGLVLAVGIAFSVYAGKLDRERIREHVESSGGHVQSIKGLWSLGFGRRAGNARHYEVRYTTHHGRTITAMCATNMFSGVWWIDQAPPGLRSAQEPIPKTPDLSPEEIRQSQATPAEPITCLSCGAKIHPRQTHCPHCGWSYEGRSTI
jgi:hypothetical protein